MYNLEWRGNDKIYVTPSRLHQFMFCPRQVFFDYYIRAPKPLKARIRMWIGKLLHFFHHIFRVGYIREELLKVEVDELEGVVLVGKPDAYRVDKDVVILEEFKSTRMPRVPNKWDLMAWESDVVQALAYAYMLNKIFGKKVFIIIRYIDGTTTFEFNELSKLGLLCVIEEYRKMVEYKLFPDAVRNRRCNRCPYRELCDTIDYGVGESEAG